jgi:thiamine pyrophosphate-dependent acetolactate synthase large subunit-like protein
MGWVSDVAAEMLRRLGIRYVAHNPGSSFAGLHDSIVNYLGNERPTMLLTLNENQAVSIAHGYARVTDTPMGVILHSNVGLMVGTMGIFNAWCDRKPMFIVGADGPDDAAKRIPWIHWIHSMRDQASMIRHYIKWDDMPRSAPAVVESMARANILARTQPCGPVYICLDVDLQQAPLDPGFEMPDLARFPVPDTPEPPASAVEAAADLLVSARSPVMLLGRGSRSESDWAARVRLAELLGCAVVSDLKTGATFPTDHPLHVGAPGVFLWPSQAAEVVKADVILGLDCIDFGGTLRAAFGDKPISAKVIHCSADSYVHNGWSMDHYSLPTADLSILADPDVTVRRLNEALDRRLQGRPPRWDGRKSFARYRNFGQLSDRAADQLVTSVELGLALDAIRENREVCFAHLPLSVEPVTLHFRHPLDYLGKHGGAGIGSGPGHSIGSALALRDFHPSRVAVSVIGDGDFLQGATALWTAAHYGIPVLMIVCNNRSYFSDEGIQRRIAIQRGRPPENSWIGQRIDQPAVDISSVARAQGVAAEGPIECVGDLLPALNRGLAAVAAGAPYLIDVIVQKTERRARS